VNFLKRGHWNQERARRDYVSLAYSNDSTLAWNDSIIHYLSLGANVNELKTLLAYHINRGQIQQSEDLLSNATTYGWSQDYHDIMNLLLDAAQDTLGAENTIHANRTMLMGIAADSTHDALLAQAVLETYGMAAYEHVIVFPNPQPKSLKQRNKKPATKSSLASVHPNPAKNQIYLNWKLPEGMNPEKVSLSVYNIQGKLVLTNTLNQEVGIHEINVSNYPTGIYLYQLQHEGKILHSEKFEVLR